MNKPTKECKSCNNYVILGIREAMCLIEDDLIEYGKEHNVDTMKFGIFVDCPFYDGDPK